MSFILLFSVLLCDTISASYILSVFKDIFMVDYARIICIMPLLCAYAPLDQISELLHSMQSCMSDVKA